MLLDDSEKVKKLQLFLKEIKIQYTNKSALVQLEGYVLEFPFNSNLVYLVKGYCFSCPVDCHKKLPIRFNNKFDNEIGKIKKIEMKNKDFSKIEIEYLSRVLLMNDKPENFFDFEKHRILLEDSLIDIEFYIFGRRSVGKTTVFNLIPGGNSEKQKEWESKVNDSFPPLKIKVFKVNSIIFEKNFIAPYLQNDLITAYMFVIVSDSTTKNVMDVVTA